MPNRRDFLRLSAVAGAIVAAANRSPSVTTEPANFAPQQERMLEDLERRHILAVLKETGGNREEAARRLGISRKTIDRKCARWNV